MKKIILTLVVLLGLVNLWFAVDCLTQEGALSDAITAKGTCDSDCELDQEQWQEDLPCPIVCSTEYDNVTSAQEALNVCEEGFAEATSCTCTDWVVNSCPAIAGRNFKPGTNCKCVDGSDVIACTETNVDQGDWEWSEEETCSPAQKIKDGTCCVPPKTPYDKETIWSEMTKCCDWTLYNKENDGTNKEKCCERWSAVIDNSCVSCSALSEEDLETYKDLCSDDLTHCKPENQYNEWPLKKCCLWTVVDSQENPGTKACIVNTEWTAGMTINSGCLINGQCKYNIYETLWIRKSDQNPSVGSFVKDIVLAVTTFIGTVVAIVLIVSGVLYIMAWIKWDTSMADKAKKWIFNSVVWLVLVVTSYAIVRLIQFLATAWWG